MESKRIERDRSESLLRRTVAGLALAAPLFAAASGGDDRTAEPADGSAETMELAGDRVPTDQAIVPREDDPDCVFALTPARREQGKQ